MPPERPLEEVPEMRCGNRVVEASRLWFCALVCALLSVGVGLAQNYRLERIASGLNQPTYVTQAPNDPANILYYTERTRDANPGFTANNVMGRVWRYDVSTRTKTLVLDLSTRSVTQDTGLQTIAFHPDFNTPESAGYGKMYLSSSQSGGTALNRVEEYTLNLAGPNPTYAATLSRLLLQYQNNAQNNHTVDWIGFDPTATGEARNYLYISTGDGSFGNAYNGGTSPTGRPSQNPNDVAGKMLRVDVAGPDAYPGDALRNYAVPASNPIPTYNAANPGSPISGLGEVYLTGLRNVYRASFDRANADLWMGDVGEVFVEEVSFFKAGTNVSGPPADFGWPQREGTVGSDVPGAPESLLNPFTGVAALQPLQQFMHDGGGEAVIGGYVYRGPIAELQGKYFYSDFVTTGNANQIWMLDFNRDTPTANYNGNNGTRTDVSALWQSLVFDPTDPSYMPNSTTGSSAGLDHIVSFGEDNAGNVYLVDFGNGSGFQGQYPGAGLGEIFRLTPVVNITVTVDRDSGGMVFSNETGAVIDIRGYTLVSAAGSLEPNAFTPITGRLDAGGNGSIDPNNNWAITSDSGDRHEFGEASTGGPASLAIDEQFVLSLDEGWIPSIYEDLQLTVVLGNGNQVPAMVEYVGNGGQPLDRSDLNFNGMLDPADWPIFRSHHLQSFPTLTRAESYHQGDLDGDGDNDFADFRLFQADYIAANGEAAFAALMNVPEPATALLLLCVCGAFSLAWRRRHRRRIPQTCLIVSAAAIGCAGVTSSANADLRHRYSFNEGAIADATGRTIIDSISGANGIVRGNGASANATQLVLSGGPSSAAPYVDLPNGLVSGLTDVTFEAWYTIDSALGTTWARIFDFGSTEGGELTGPGGGGQGLDNIFYAPMRGSNIDQQRAGLRNNDPLFRPGGSPGPVGAAEMLIDPEFNHTLDSQYHVALVYDADGGNDPGEASLTLYINGARPAGEDVNPTETMVQLENLNDVNNWLGRSNWTGDSNLDGMLNEFRIYDSPLSAEEVAANTAAGPDVVPVFEVITLRVNTITGSVHITSNLPTPINLDYYKITSAAGALDTAGWNSLADQNRDAIGPGQGESWDEADQSDQFALAELFLLGASGVSSAAPLGLGHAFDVNELGPGKNGDLQFQYAKQGSGLVAGMVSYVTPGPLAGDYNDNGTVDAADYVVWRNTLGSPTVLDADGDADGDVDEHDYKVWRATFGNTAPAGALIQAAAVPEPAGIFLIMLAALYATAAQPRVRSKHT
jgi:hypothetical protein